MSGSCLFHVRHLSQSIWVSSYVHDRQLYFLYPSRVMFHIRVQCTRYLRQVSITYVLELSILHPALVILRSFKCTVLQVRNSIRIHVHKLILLNPCFLIRIPTFLLRSRRSRSWLLVTVFTSSLFTLLPCPFHTRATVVFL